MTTSQLFALRALAPHRNGWRPPDSQTVNLLASLRAGGYVTYDKQDGWKITWDGTVLLNDLAKRL